MNIFCGCAKKLEALETRIADLERPKIDTVAPPWYAGSGCYWDKRITTQKAIRLILDHLKLEVHAPESTERPARLEPKADIVTTTYPFKPTQRRKRTKPAA